MIQMKVYKHPAIQMRQIRFGHWHRCVLVLPDALDPAEKDLCVLYSKAILFQVPAYYFSIPINQVVRPMYSAQRTACAPMFVPANKSTLKRSSRIPMSSMK
ncbi:MAG: hypothetical protein PHU24_09550 [Sphaerochaetaceae bacterium]|nr:hypothetical protein [Sphaerochaetaceae bacterium]MDD2406689.1 hypothetical protein [Sphaerochaetaceae bacterium]MDD4259242.1 hypothetical protein [Sphaerochaetaceae bacterium]MDD5076108.1 hypothetical protein [Sphaerochaetaceae bacterium]